MCMIHSKHVQYLEWLWLLEIVVFETLRNGSLGHYMLNGALEVGGVRVSTLKTKSLVCSGHLNGISETLMHFSSVLRHLKSVLYLRDFGTLDVEC